MKRPYHPVRNSLLSLCHWLELGLAPVAPVWMPKRAELNHIQISESKGAKGLRIAQVSDLHAASWLDDDYLTTVAQQIQNAAPHLLVWTGDFYLHSPKQLQRCLAFFADLHRKLPSFAVLGNHDFDIECHETAGMIEDSGAQVLRNRYVDDPIAGFELRLLGLDDYQVTRSTFAEADFQSEPNQFKLLLSHQPAMAHLLPANSVGLMLSGHLHGGQLNFPLIGAPYVPPPGGRPFIEKPTGTINGNRYHVNRGLGFSMLPVRIGAPPEITLIELV